jgi:hypothetical protein
MYGMPAKGVVQWLSITKSATLDCCFLLQHDYRNDSQEAWPHRWRPFLYGCTSMFRLSIVCVEAGRNGWHWHLIKAIIQPVHSLVARSKQESPKCRACMILPNNSIRCFTINKRLNFESNNKGSSRRCVKLILMPLVWRRLAEGSASYKSKFIATHKGCGSSYWQCSKHVL